MQIKYRGRQKQHLRGLNKADAILSNYRVRILRVSGKQQHVLAVVSNPNGDQYVTSWGAGFWYCTCPGFKYRGQCKHKAALFTLISGREKK